MRGNGAFRFTLRNHFAGRRPHDGRRHFDNDEQQGYVVDTPDLRAAPAQQNLRDLALPVRCFGDIKHLLPQDCWAVSRNARQGEFEDESVLFHEGSLTLSALDLDDVLGTGEHIFLVFVQGDLRVDGPIFNDDTDGATGLIVGGNLSCRNAAVGGQQIYVTGNLDVGELFWGDYNHGELIVAGNATAPMVVTTNQYDLTVRGERAFARWILDEEPGGEDWRFDDIDALGEYIDPDFIFEDDDELSLDRDEIIAAMQENRSVIQPQAAEDAAAIDQHHPDHAINYQNIQRIATPGWVTADEEGEVQGQEEFWVDDICCRIALVPDGKNPLETSLYFQRDENLGVMILLTNAHQDASAWAAEHADKEANGQYLSIGWRDIAADGLWAMLDEQAPPAAHTLLAEGWRLALTFAAAQERIRQEISPATLRELLALPLVEPYDDFEDDDKNGLWVGNTYCSFNQENVEEDERPMLRVTVEEDDSSFYYFEVIGTAAGGEKIDISFSPDLDSEEDIYPGQTGGPELDRALRLFKTAKRNLLRANEELLAGTFFTDDDFARKHWVRKGYMKKRLP